MTPNLVEYAESMLRRLAYFCSRQVVLKKKLPEDFSSYRLNVSPSSSLRFWFQSLEKSDPGLFFLARTFIQPGMKVWDIGASAGIFTFSSAISLRGEGMVIAVEPDPFQFQCLQRSLRNIPELHELVHLVHGAVSDREGEATFHFSRLSRASNHLSEVAQFQTRQVTGGKRASGKVKLYTLDSLAKDFEKPDLIKVDVEGAEHLLLRGARDLFSAAKPAVFIEIKGAHQEEVLNFFIEHGYLPFGFVESTLSFREGELAYNTFFVHLQSPLLERLRELSHGTLSD